MKAKVIEVRPESVIFDNGFTLKSSHQQDCCESHWLSFNDISLSDFDGLEFDLSNEKFFNRIEGFGIELVPIEGYSVKVPGYGSNNGYYSSNLSLILLGVVDTLPIETIYDISECQDIDWQ